MSGADQQRSLQQGLSRLEQALESLPIPAAELQRRRRLVQGLQQQTAGGAYDGSGGMGGSPSGGGGQPQQSRMAVAMRQQDEMIGELAVGVSRLKNQTQLIGEEANLHVNLMNDMEANLDAAHEGLAGETRRATQLKQDQSVWRLQLIVAGECVVLVILIVLGIS